MVGTHLLHAGSETRIGHAAASEQERMNQRSTKLISSTGCHGRTVELGHDGKHECGKIPVSHADRL